MATVIMDMVMNDGILVIIALFAVAGGGIIVIDVFILRKLRRNATQSPPADAGPPGAPSLGTSDE